VNNISKRFEEDHMERYRFASKIAKGKSLLDLACGGGASTPLFIEAGIRSYDGLDINEKQFTSASNKYALSDCINYHVGDLCTFNNGRKFDIITCYGIIEHIEDYESAIKNFHSLLKPGGALLISSPNRLITSPDSLFLNDKPANKSHTQEFTPEELLSILNCSGFIADQNNIYGQRQRRFFSSKFLNNVIHFILRKTQKAEEAIVTAVKDKEPEHFIVVATKA